MHVKLGTRGLATVCMHGMSPIDDHVKSDTRGLATMCMMHGVSSIGNLKVGCL